MSGGRANISCCGQRSENRETYTAIDFVCGSTTYVITEFRRLSTSESTLKDYIVLTNDVTCWYQLLSLTFQLLLVFVVYLAFC
jgi:hypothetical protein